MNHETSSPKEQHTKNAGHHSSMNCVSKVPIFNHLSPEQMTEIKELSQSLVLEKGDTLYRSGEESDTLYIVNSGRIRIYRITESGKERLLKILHSGEFTGEMALFTESLHESYAEAMEKTVVCTITRKKFHELLLKYPTIALATLHELAYRLKSAEAQATRFVTAKVESRIASFLIESINDADNPSSEIVLPMSKKDLASYLGTTPETISRKLSQLEDEGLILQKSSRRIKILDAEGLKNV